MCVVSSQGNVRFGLVFNEILLLLSLRRGKGKNVREYVSHHFLGIAVGFKILSRFFY